MNHVPGIYIIHQINAYLHYLLGRSAEKLKIVETYLRANAMFRNYADANQDPVYTQVIAFLKCTKE